MNFYFLKKQISQTPIVPMQEESFENILTLVRDCYRNTKSMNDVVDDVFTDTKQMYHEAMQKSVIQSSLITPNVKGLESDVIGIPPKEPQ